MNRTKQFFVVSKQILLEGIHLDDGNTKVEAGFPYDVVNCFALDNADHKRQRLCVTLLPH